MNEYIKTDKYGKYYYKDKEMTILHREDGPAIEHTNGAKSWWLNGKLHRMDGPATYAFSGYNSWYINDVIIFSIDKSGNLIRRMW